MSRRHAFRPAALDLLEGRLAPSAFLTGGTGAPAHAARAAHTTHAKSVDWHKVGTQVTDFLGITHKAKSHATAARPTAPGRLLRHG